MSKATVEFGQGVELMDHLKGGSESGARDGDVCVFVSYCCCEK